MSRADKVIDVDTLSPNELKDIVQDLLDKLGYEVRYSEEDCIHFLVEQSGMTGAKGTYDSDY